MTDFFIGAKPRKTIEEGINILGIPFNQSPHTIKTNDHVLKRLRSISSKLETYSHYLDLDLRDYQNIFDLGNLKENSFKEIEKRIDGLLENINLKNSKLLTLIEENSTNLFPLTQYLNIFPNLTIIHLSAYASLKNEYKTNENSLQCLMNQILKYKKNNQHLLQFGIRSGSKEEFKLMKQRHTLFRSIHHLIDQIKNLPKNNDVYLVLDMSFFDPVYVKVSAPQVGGYSFEDFIQILKSILINDHRIVGANIMNLAPTIASKENTYYIANIIKNTLLAMNS